MWTGAHLFVLVIACLAIIVIQHGSVVSTTTLEGEFWRECYRIQSVKGLKTLTQVNLLLSSELNIQICGMLLFTVLACIIMQKDQYNQQRGARMDNCNKLLYLWVGVVTWIIDPIHLQLICNHVNRFLATSKCEQNQLLWKKLIFEVIVDGFKGIINYSVCNQDKWNYNGTSL